MTTIELLLSGGLGEEFVTFLVWSPAANAFLVHTQMSWVFPIQDGRTGGGTMPVDDLLTELRALSARR